MGRVVTSLRAAGKHSDTVWVYLDRERFARVTSKDVVELGLRQGLELTPSQEKEVLHRSRVLEARTAAVSLLSHRPRSRAELLRRLKTKGFDRRTIDEVLRDLERLGYVNDAEYARALAEQLCSSGQYGRRAVESKLKQRGLPLDVVREAVEEASREIDEYEAARELAEARLRRLTRLDPKKKRERVYGFLMRRGFAADVVHDVIESLLPADD